MHRSIICIGNRYRADDCAGPAVYERLRHMQVETYGIELVEGGLAGLNLLSCLEKGGRVVFVDAVRKITNPGGVVVLSLEDIVSSLSHRHFGHDTGLPYVLSILPKVCEGELPQEILLVGIEGDCTDNAIETAADLSIRLVLGGEKDIHDGKK